MVRLHDSEKQEIVRGYLQGITQKDLAYMYLVSPRTIGRVLRDAGVTTPTYKVSPIEYSMVEMLRKYELDVRNLRVILRIAFPEVK